MSTTKPENDGLLRVTGSRVSTTYRSMERAYDKTPSTLQRDLRNRNRVNPQQVALREAAEDSIRRGLDQVAEGRVVPLDHLLDEE